MLCECFKILRIISTRPEEGKKKKFLIYLEVMIDRETSDICYCCIYNISDTIQYYPHRPSKAFFFIFSTASNEKNRKPQSRTPLRSKLVWAAIEAMVTFMELYFWSFCSNIMCEFWRRTHKSQLSNSLCTAAPSPQKNIGEGAPSPIFFLRGGERLCTG